MNVALIDDHDIVAVAVQGVVSRIEGLEFVGSAGTVEDLLDAHPDIDVAVLDLRLADGSSPVANVERLIAAGARVLVLTSGENPYLIRSVAKSPILGLVRKSAPLPVLVETLVKVASGEMELSTSGRRRSQPILSSTRLG